MSVRDQAPGTASFAVRVQPERDVVCILPEGELDLASVAVLEEQVAELIDAGFMRLVIDLRGLTFMDVSGVRLLLGLARQARGGRLSLIPAGGQVQRVLELTGAWGRLSSGAEMFGR